jgi:hypothetical protein
MLAGTKRFPAAFFEEWSRRGARRRTGQDATICARAATAATLAGGWLNAGHPEPLAGRQYRLKPGGRTVYWKGGS